jgi:hypothetical protein
VNSSIGSEARRADRKSVLGNVACYGPLGPGFALWLALLAGASLWLARGAGAARLQSLSIWSAFALAAAALCIFRNLEPLLAGMLLVILAAAVLTLVETAGTSLRDARVSDYFFTGVKLPLYIATLAPQLLGHIDHKALSRHPGVPGILRGLAMALPVLVVFGALFAAADATFNRYALALTAIVPDLPRHVLMIFVFGWIAIGLLALACRLHQPAQRPSAQPLALGTTEATVILGLVSALFVLFVLLQLGYLFGGSAVIESTSGLTVADYARRGFFELVIVAALTLVLLFVIGTTDCERRVLRRFGFVLIGCVLVMLCSALQRLLLYTDTFGLTLGRVTALVFMLWEVANLLSFAATVLQGRIGGFVSGLVISGLCSLLALGAIDPAGRVASFNIQRALKSQGELDVAYLLTLGSDAVPPLLASFDALPREARCAMAEPLLDRYLSDPQRSEDWRNWNASRAAARAAVAAKAPELRARSTC